MTDDQSKVFLDKIRSTYREAKSIPDVEIKTQLEFAEILVNKDIKNSDLDEELKDMGVIYLTSHYLYLNYSKTKKDSLQNFTSKERATGILGKGLEASPYGQQYMLISNKKQSEENSGDIISSGVMFL
ncbi:hypothetical protein [Cetobacterium sp.]|uniref:hypothetical protein n=1 Tax=Cetobacterium sp. TaxID=2071632 RepID=UPI003F674F7F